MSKMTNKPYSRSNNGIRLPFAYLYLQNEFYYFYLEGHPNHVSFIIPTKFQVLESCKPTSKKPPTIYIIFRNPVQKCLKQLNLKFERKDVSKISSDLWRRIDSNLRTRFENLYNEIIEEWRKGRLIFEFFNPLIAEAESSAEHEQTNPDSSDPNSPESVSSSSTEFENKLSYRENQLVIGELFGWGYVPLISGYNKYLESP